MAAKPGEEGIRAISSIAYGFMGSQALYSALELGVFTALSAGPRGGDDLAAGLGAAPGPFRALLAALEALGLLEREGEGLYRNAEAAGTYLDGASRRYIGDYYLRQVAALLYPSAPAARAAVRGADAAPADYFAFLDEPARAEEFIRGQHNGSAGPAYLLAKRLDLSGSARLLDLGGGSGVFAIEMVRRNPGLSAVVVDHPKVAAVAEKIVAEAGLSDRIACAGGDALEGEWPPDGDVILLSYVISSYGEEALASLLARAFAYLPSGGRLIVHDFALHGDRPGPRTSALWFFANLAISDATHPHTAPGIAAALARAGFASVTAAPHIPDVTHLFTGRKEEG